MTRQSHTQAIRTGQHRSLYRDHPNLDKRSGTHPTRRGRFALFRVDAEELVILNAPIRQARSHLIHGNHQHSQQPSIRAEQEETA